MTEATEKTTKTWANADGTITYSYIDGGIVGFKVMQHTMIGSNPYSFCAKYCKNAAEARKFIRKATAKPTRADGKSYRVVEDNIYTHIELSDEAPDFSTHYAEFSDAKAHVQKLMRDNLQSWQDALDNSRSWTEESMA